MWFSCWTPWSLLTKWRPFTLNVTRFDCETGSIVWRRRAGLSCLTVRVISMPSGCRQFQPCAWLLTLGHPLPVAGILSFQHPIRWRRPKRQWLNFELTKLFFLRQYSSSLLVLSSTNAWLFANVSRRWGWVSTLLSQQTNREIVLRLFVVALELFWFLVRILQCD